MSDNFDEYAALRALQRETRRFNRRNLNAAPPTLHQLPILITPNHPFDDTDQFNGDKVLSDYFKIDLRNSQGSILLNTSLFHRIARLIRSRYGEFPRHGSLICTSIVILPQADQRCSLYYCEGHNDANPSDITFDLIGSFIGNHKPTKLSVGCPYTDSLNRDRNVRFNWFTNHHQTGVTIPKLIKSQYELPYNNCNMAWVSSNPYGSYYIDGLQDAIGFNVTFIGCQSMLDHCRQTASYLRADRVRFNRSIKKRKMIHIPRTVFHDDNYPIDYILPSFDTSENEDDPLLEALK